MGLHTEIFVSVVNNREGTKDEKLPTEQPATIFEWFVPSTRIFLAKAVYLVLGSSYPSAMEILTPGTSTTSRM